MTTILVIEDELPILDTILDTLDAEGFEVYGAENGSDGLLLAFEHVPDLVICDVTMPGLNGYEVLADLRQDPRTTSIPFMFLTAMTDREHRRQGMSLGADDYVTKPFTTSELLDVVKTRIERHAAYRDLQKQYDQIYESDQLKTDMIRMAAHDLRSPLTAVSLSVSQLRRRYGDDLVDQHLTELKHIASAADHMTDITNNILSLERIEAALCRSNHQPFDIIKLVARSYEDHQFQAHQKSQDIALSAPSDPLLVLGDDAQLREAIDNLIGNAIKYTPEGGRIAVTLERLDKIIRFLVKDNGYGIPDTEKNHLFKPFYRVTDKATAHTEGTGLGLHLVKRIIERHDGQILFASVYGRGSQFGFKLPSHELGVD